MQTGFPNIPNLGIVIYRKRLHKSFSFYLSPLLSLSVTLSLFFNSVQLVALAAFSLHTLSIHMSYDRSVAACELLFLCLDFVSCSLFSLFFSLLPLSVVLVLWELWDWFSNQAKIEYTRRLLFDSETTKNSHVLPAKHMRCSLSLSITPSHSLCLFWKFM